MDFVKLIVFNVMLFRVIDLTAHFIAEKCTFHSIHHGNDKEMNYTFIESSNGMKIPYYIVDSKLSNDSIIILSHGNGDNIYTSLYGAEHISDITKIPVLIYDYQGYGHAEGESNEQNCYDDLEKIVEIVKKTYTKIYLMGHSLGTGIVVDYAEKHNWTQPIILIAPYASIIRTFTDKISTYLYCLLYNGDLFKTTGKIDKLNCFVHIIHSKTDALIPINHPIELHEKCKYKSDIVWLERTDHGGEILILNSTIMDEIIKNK
jgi:pimeloyl-ACP methyl ester carboxylesterase